MNSSIKLQNILIMEDTLISRKVITQVFKYILPLATVSEFVFSKEERFENMIEKNHYDLVALDGDLSTKWLSWGDLANGKNLIPIIKQKSPKTLVLAMSNEFTSNQEMIVSGADFSILKTDISKDINLLKKVLHLI